MVSANSSHSSIRKHISLLWLRLLNEPRDGCSALALPRRQRRILRSAQQVHSGHLEVCTTPCAGGACESSGEVWEERPV